jgi:asparagine synthase (glutamine-hydrolysing)
MHDLEMLQPRPDLLGRRLGAGLVLMDATSDALYELNESGARLWELLTDGHSAKAAVERLAAEFDAPLAQVRQDVAHLMDELRQRGLLRAPPVQETTTTVSLPRAWESTGPQSPRRSGWVLSWSADRREAPRIDGAPASLGYATDADANVAVLSGWAHDDRGLLLRGDPGAVQLLERGVDDPSALARALRGPFVAILWNRRRNELTLVRDAVGVHPLFYSDAAASTLVSSDLDALLAAPGVTSRFARAAVAEYALGASPTSATETLYADVHRVPGGHLLGIGQSGRRLERYWEPRQIAERSELDGARLVEALGRAVGRCLEAGADCLGLSGGFDSVSIAALAAQQGATLGALCLRHTDESTDESATQQAVAELLGFPLYQRDVGPDAGFVERALAASAASPSPILSPWQWMFRALLDEATTAGYRHLMMGTGGDELFTVDPALAGDLLARGRLREVWQFYSAWAATSPFSAAAIARLLLWHHGVRQAGVALATRWLPHGVTARWRAARGNGAWARRLGTQPALREELAERAFPRSAPRPSTTSAYVDACRGLMSSPALAMELDQAAALTGSQGASVSYPFFDRDLIELALSAPPSILYDGGRMKGPLRRLVERALPGAPLAARKVDFTASARRLFRTSGAQAWRNLGSGEALVALGIADGTPLRHYMNDFFAGHGPTNLRRVWCILSAETWLRTRTVGR